MTKIGMCMLVIGVAMSVPAGAASANQGNPGIKPIGSKIVTVKTYADLGAEWWQWAVQAPKPDSPLLDEDGSNCRVGQQGPVWFLATKRGSGDLNNPTVRTCDVPAGKAIFFPVINNAYFAFLNDLPETRTAEYVREQAQNYCDSDSIRNLSVTIDGVPVWRPARFVTTADQSPLFQAQLPPDNIYDVVPDYVQELLFSPSAHKGFYIYLKPLPPGPHTIAWTATWDCNSGMEELSENVRYNLNVLSGVSGEVE